MKLDKTKAIQWTEPAEMNTLGEKQDGSGREERSRRVHERKGVNDLSE